MSFTDRHTTRLLKIIKSETHEISVRFSFKKLHLMFGASITCAVFIWITVSILCFDVDVCVSGWKFYK